MKLPQRFTSDRNYFFTIFVIGALLFATFSTVLYRQYNEARFINDRAIHYYEMLRRARLIYIHLLNMETGSRGYLMTGKKNFLTPYETSQGMVDEHMNAVIVMAEDNPDIRQPLENIRAKADEFKALLRSEIQLFDAKGRSAATDAMLEKQKQQMDDLRGMLDNFLRDSRFNLQNYLDDSNTKSREFVSSLTIGTALAIGVMLLITLLVLSLLARSRRAEEEVRRSDERLLAIMNELNDGVFDYDLRNKAIYFSPSYKSMLGYNDQEHPDTIEAFRQHLHPDDADIMSPAFTGLLNRQAPAYSSVFRLRHKDGNWRWILSRGIGIWNRKGEMERLIGVHTDITEQKNREEELKQLNSDMESFIYIASHDLRSPLVNLKGFAGEIEHAIRMAKPTFEHAKHALSPEDRSALQHIFENDIPESLGFIGKAVGTMDKLTSAVLDLSRIGSRELRMEPIDTKTLVERSIDGMAYVISQKEAEVVCESLPQIVSDALSIEHIFNNLLDNALKYLSPERKGKITVSSQITGRDVIFSVKDNGRGIAREDRKKIFEIFRRARNTGDVHGLGMGMAYVKATVRRLGGSIWFDSTLNEGTTFYLRLPVLENKKA